MISYASMGFQPIGDQLDGVRDVPYDLKTYASHGRGFSGMESAEIEAHREAKMPAAFASHGNHSENVDAMREAEMPKAFATHSMTDQAHRKGSPSWSAPREADAQGYPHILVSFAYDEDHSFFERKLGYDPPDWLGDSGAFTAWTMGKTIELDKLIEWCSWHVERKPGFVCISLDVIPGEYGGNRQPTKKQKREAMVESLANGDAMRAAGLKIMEVFHVFEPIEQLDVLLERRQPGEIIGLGGMVGRSTEVKRQFADACFSRIREHAGGWQGIVPLHALGLSVRSNLAARYPWWSMDSSTWIAPAQYGQGVKRDGRPTGQRDRRASNKDVRHVYLVRTLEGWLQKEQALTRLWRERGVTFAPDMEGA